MPVKPPERTEGPTPGGGAYAVAYRGADGSIVEIVEFAADRTAPHRTYAGRTDELVEVDASDLLGGING
jgi:hypothetical protein